MYKKNHWGQLICTVVVTGALTACTTTRSEPSAEFLAPISDQTVDLVGDVHFGLQLADSVQLNHYFDSDTPKIDAWSVLWDDLVSAMRAIVYYSSDLVDIAEVAEGTEAIEPLIALISTLDSEIRALSSARAHLGSIDANSVSAEMREQENFNKALRVAQPLMSDYADSVTEILAAADQALTDAIMEVFELIESTHSPMLTYRENLTVRQNSTLTRLAMMDKAWTGDESSWTELLASDWVLSSEIGKKSRLTPDTAKQAEKLLIRRLESVATIRQHLEPALVAYQNELQELYVIEENSEAMLRLALLIIENWESAQAQLAAGERGAFAAFTSSLMKVVYRAAASRIAK